MAINRIECPECGAGLKSASGFKAGQYVACPKCEVNFAVELPANDEDEAEDVEEVRPAKKKAKAVAARPADEDDDDDDRPKKKKKKKKGREDDDDDDESERSYKNSPIRFAILGVLVVVMIVLGVMLIIKKQNENKETANAGDNPEQTGNPPIPPPPGGLQIPGPPGIGGGPAPKGGFPAPKGGFPAPKGGFPAPKGGNGGFVPNNGGGPVGGDSLFADTPRPGSPEFVQNMNKLGGKIVGSWEGTTPNGQVLKVTYQSSGQFTLDAGGKQTNGKWQATDLIGGKVLKINRGGVILKVAFEGDELIHDTGTPGETVVLKKK